jgi:NADPH:quinone reductase-like Zn-dependent oxidoreductase
MIASFLSQQTDQLPFSSHSYHAHLRMPQVLEAAKMIVDTAVSTVWWACTVPSVKAMRMVGLAKPQPLPATDLTGKIAVVTGGASGIGSRTIFHLAKRGATVIFGDKDMQGGERTKACLVKELKDAGLQDAEQKLKVLLHLSNIDSNMIQLMLLLLLYLHEPLLQLR